jgi:hypothetical protein
MPPSLELVLDVLVSSPVSPSGVVLASPLLPTSAELASSDVIAVVLGEPVASASLGPLVPAIGSTHAFATDAGAWDP